jgi:hypothetical protein
MDLSGWTFQKHLRFQTVTEQRKILLPDGSVVWWLSGLGQDRVEGASEGAAISCQGCLSIDPKSMTTKSTIGILQD